MAKEKENDKIKEEKFYVQSTDSGLFKIREHYGTLIDADDLDAWNELLDRLSAGSLALDLTQDEVSDIDINNLKYFETWSYLITVEAYSVISKTLNLIDLGFKKKGISYFLSEVRKNPMRKFYFDTGIYRAAQLAGEGNYPKISYLTTLKSKIPDPYFETSKKLWEQFMDTKGIEYFFLNKNGWLGEYKEFAKLTLVPSLGLQKYTNFLISIRDSETRKIVHGVESYGKYIFIKEMKKELVELHLEDWLAATGIIFFNDVKSLILTVAPFVGRVIRSLIKTQNVEDRYQKVKKVRENNIAIQMTNKNINLLKSKG